MQIKSSNNSKEKDFSQSLEIKKEDLSCKDGFCTLPSQNKNPSTRKNQVDFFDPIQS